MKKFYLLLAAACVAASASAVEKEMSTSKATQKAEVGSKKAVSALNMKPMAVAPVNLNAKQMGTRADEDSNCTLFRAADQVMTFGFTSQGYGLKSNFGFASSYGNVVFNNYSWGTSSSEWSFSEVGGFNGDAWDVQTSSEEDLVIKSGIGEMMPPTLATKYEDGGDGSYESDLDDILCGGSSEYWLGEGDEKYGIYGLSFYQNIKLEDPQGDTGSFNPVNAFVMGAQQGWNENGVYNNPSNKNNWETRFSETIGAPVSDLKMDAYYLMQPKPTSTYFFTTAWVWCGVIATADTQLISYVYPVSEDGEIDEMPIALGYAAIPKGDTGMVQFYYNPLDENGDELEGEVFVDSAVAITIEGFTGNDAITQVAPASGYYPFSYASYAAGNRGLFKTPTLWISFSMTADDKTYSMMAYDGAAYYFDQRDEKPGVTLDRNTIALQCYAQLCMDAVYPYIHAVNGEESINVAEAGEEVSFDIEALYYNVAGLVEEGYYEVTAPEWIKVEFGEPSQQTGITTMKLTVEPSEAGRTGVVSIEGIGATFSLEVIQGEGNAVSTIVVDKNAEYFDLAGRRVANPEKGIYIKKAGNKAEKVLF